MRRAIAALAGEAGIVRVMRNLFFGPPVVDTLPTASVDYRSTIAIVEGGAGVADALYRCAKDASDAYAWVDLDSGDVSGPSSSTNSGIVLFNGTTGKLLKQATGTGLVKATSGVYGTATSGTDYAPATSGTSILKGNGAGGFSSAVASTDYAPATTGSSILKASSGGFANATSGTDYAPATSGTAILKGNGSGGFSAAVPLTDYLITAGGGTQVSDYFFDETNTIIALDATFIYMNDADHTKRVIFDLSNYAHATSRTISFPNGNTTLLGIDELATVSNKSLDNSNDLTVKDSAFTLQDDGNTTRQVKFQLSGISNSTTRTLTVPNASGTMTLLGNSSTGSGNVVLDTSPTIVTPTIASLTNAQHGHLNAAGGGQLTGAFMAAGTSSAGTWPKLTSGTVLTTPEAGAIEYDGTVIYLTPAASNRAASGGFHGIFQDADYTGSNSNTAQKVFNGSTNGTITLPGSTTYLLEAVYHIHTTGTTSHTLGVGFGGTATLTSIGYLLEYANATSEAFAAVNRLWVTTASNTTTFTAAASASHTTLFLKGQVRINASGTFIPQYTWSAAPGVAGVTLLGSYCTLTPIGSNTMKTVGNWS